MLLTLVGKGTFSPLLFFRCWTDCSSVGRLSSSRELIALSGLLVVMILFSPEYGGGANVSDGGGGEKDASRVSSSFLKDNKR